MAYMSQEMKKSLAPRIKNILKKYGMKGTLGVNHYSTLRLNLSKGRLDLIGDAQIHNNEYCEKRGLPIDSYVIDRGYLQVNEYHAAEHSTDPEIKSFYEEIVDAMNGRYEDAPTSNYDNSDYYTDYFDVGWYIDINVGKWNKPYILEA